MKSMVLWVLTLSHSIPLSSSVKYRAFSLLWFVFVSLDCLYLQVAIVTAVKLKIKTL